MLGNKWGIDLNSQICSNTHFCFWIYPSINRVKHGFYMLRMHVSNNSKVQFLKMLSLVLKFPHKNHLFECSNTLEIIQISQYFPLGHLVWFKAVLQLLNWRNSTEIRELQQFNQRITTQVTKPFPLEWEIWVEGPRNACSTEPMAQGKYTGSTSKSLFLWRPKRRSWERSPWISLSVTPGGSKATQRSS